MTTEQTSATVTIAPEEPSSTVKPPETSIKQLEVKATLPIPTDEEVQEHGFYYYWLPERERVLYRAALRTEGLRQEIAAVRTAIGYIMLINPANLAVLKAISLLERLIRTNYSLFDKQEQPERVQAPTNQTSQSPSPNSEERIPRSERRRLAREQAKSHLSS